MRNTVNWSGVIAKAGNLRGGENPPFSKVDFLDVYPQFKDKLPDAALEMYIDYANNVLLESRWHSQWKMGMQLMIAHYCTLWLQTSAGIDETDPAAVGDAGMKKNEMSSATVDGVSVAYQNNSQSAGTSWGDLEQTEFGIQFVSMAKRIGAGPMYAR